MTTTPALVDERPDLATVSLATLKYLGLDPAAIPTRALVAVSQHYRLDPLVGEIQLIQTKNGPRVYITRDGMIALAHRTGELDGIVVDEERRSSRDDGYTCYVSVYRKGCRYPFRYGAQCKDSEAQARAGNGPEMALARAERRALKRAFAVGAAAFDPDDEPDNDYHAGAGNVGGMSAPADAQPLTEPAPAPKAKRTRKAVAQPTPLTDDEARAMFAAKDEARAAAPLPRDWPATPAVPRELDLDDAIARAERYGEPIPGERLHAADVARTEDEPPARIPPTLPEERARATDREPVAGRLQSAAHRVVASWPEEKRDAFLAAWHVDDFGEVWAADVVDAALEEPF